MWMQALHNEAFSLKPLLCAWTEGPLLLVSVNPNPKRNGYIPPTGLTGKVSAEDLKDAMSAVESMARANQSIDHPSISGFSSAHEKRSFNLWSVMNAVMSPVKVQSMHDEDETVATGIFAEPTTSPIRNRHKSKRKKKGDGGSIISSFF